MHNDGSFLQPRVDTTPPTITRIFTQRRRAGGNNGSGGTESFIVLEQRARIIEDDGNHCWTQ